MAYRGVNAVPLPELTSQRRLREAAGILPDGSGFFTATVKTKRDKEGGPGSGPRKGSGTSQRDQIADAGHFDKAKGKGKKSGDNVSENYLRSRGLVKVGSKNGASIFRDKGRGDLETAGHVAVKSDGSWSHNYGGETFGKGKDVASLRKYYGGHEKWTK